VFCLHKLFVLFGVSVGCCQHVCILNVFRCQCILWIPVSGLACYGLGCSCLTSFVRFCLFVCVCGMCRMPWIRLSWLDQICGIERLCACVCVCVRLCCSLFCLGAMYLAMLSSIGA
jgi:hypothetical protein